MTDPDWPTWLQEWSRVLLASAGPDEDLPPDVAASGWLGYPGATEAQLGALEARLGTRLPPSYRSFLQTSNGFRQPGVLVPRVLPAEEVDWFRTRHQDTIEEWNLGTSLGGGAPGDPASFVQDLPTALQVSDVEPAGTAVYLLNPRVVDAAGEWEAFYFAHWLPGVNRHPSFRALMEAERSNWTPPDRPSAAPPPRPSPWLWNTLKRIF